MANREIPHEDKAARKKADKDQRAEKARKELNQERLRKRREKEEDW